LKSQNQLYKDFIKHTFIDLLSKFEDAIDSYNNAEPESNDMYRFFGHIEALSHLIEVIAGFYDSFEIPAEERVIDKRTADKGISKLKRWPKKF
jgi:hypothetical protein